MNGTNVTGPLTIPNTGGWQAWQTVTTPVTLSAGQQVAHTGSWKLGARVVPGHFAQTHARPELDRRSLTAILWEDHAKDRGAAMVTNNWA